MKAAVVRALGEPLAVEERPDPEPGPGQGRIRVEASGLCRTASVTGSVVGTRQDLAEVFRLHADGRTRVIPETRPLTSLNESIEDVLGGRVRARTVFDLATEG